MSPKQPRSRSSPSSSPFDVIGALSVRNDDPESASLSAAAAETAAIVHHVAASTSGADAQDAGLVLALCADGTVAGCVVRAAWTPVTTPLTKK